MAFRNNSQNTKWWVPTKKFISDTLLVALLTGVGYLATYVYQYSYLKYFNIPNFLIDINLGQILFTTFVGLIVLLIVAMVINLFTGWKPKRKLLKITKAACSFIILLALFTYPIVATTYDPGNLWPFLVMLLAIFLGLIVLIIKLYINPDLLDETEWSGFRADTGQKRNKKDLLYKAEQLYGSFPILFFGILIILIFFNGLFGIINAQNQSEYLVSNTNPRLIIVSTYPDGFIGLTFNSSTNKFNKDIHLLSKDKVSEDNINLSFEKIGRLTSN